MSERRRQEWIAPGLAQLFEIVLDAAADPRDLTTGERDQFFAAGEAAFDDSGSLSQLIETYLAGAGELWESVFGTVAPGQAIEVGRSLRRVSESAVGDLAAGFESAQRRSIRAEEALRRDVIADLMAGRGESPVLEERARLAGFPIAARYRVLVADCATPVADYGPVHRRVQTELDSRAPERSLAVFVHVGQLVVLAGSAEVEDFHVVVDAVQAADDRAWVCGLGRPTGQLAEFKQSYIDACEAVRLSRTFGLGGFAVFDTLFAHRMMAADRELARALADSVVGPLEHSRGSLVETLEAFMRHGGNMAAVARELSLGSRTVAYRLERIAELSGYSPRDPDGRLTLELALRCRGLLDNPGS